MRLRSIASGSLDTMKAETLVSEVTTASAVRVPARAPRWVVPLVKLALVFTDATLALLCFVAAFYVRHYQSIIQRGTAGSLTWSRDFAPYALLLPLIIPIRVLLLRYNDLYRVRGEFSFVDDVARTAAIHESRRDDQQRAYRGRLEYPRHVIDEREFSAHTI